VWSALLALFVLASLAAAPVDASPDGQALYEVHCAACHHDPHDAKAPTLDALRLIHPRRMLHVLTEGAMQSQAAGMTGAEIQTLVAYLAGRDAPPDVDASAFCDDRSLAVRAEAGPRIANWGMAPGAGRYLNDAQTAIDAGNVARLELKWAFGLPGTDSARAQPVIDGDALYVASTSGDLFRLDRHRGCIEWHHRNAIPLRTSLALGDIDGHAVLYIGDAAGGINAFDALSGAPLWRTRVSLFDASMLTGAPLVHGERVIVPISSFEVGMARNPRHECCRTHGGVRALHARTGEILWTTRLAEPATLRGENGIGIPQWGPSGVPVWSAPTVDARRGRIYIGTGQNYSLPATAYSDAILALDLETGAIVWHRQTYAGDVWNSACTGRTPGPNCPPEPGPDYDFGAGVIIATTSDSREVLLAGQKSGVVFALDPDADGRVLWETQVGAGSALGGVHWGLALEGQRLFVPIADPAFSRANGHPRPGLYAVSIDDGGVVWEARAPENCTLAPGACRYFFRLSAAPTAVPGVVFAPGLDGQLRAFAAADGALLWSFDTLGEHVTVNGIVARGGSIDSAGVVAAGTMLYAQSGYGGFGQMPGNVVLAFDLAKPD
jgi:polyvinyl alcohol dehydrogenase (cytochrome)